VLVIALGASPDIERIPNLYKTAYDINSLTSVLQLQDALKDYTGGNLLVNSPPEAGVDPLGPLEFALLLKVAVGLLDPPVLNPKICLTIPSKSLFPCSLNDRLKILLEEKGIELRSEYRALYVDPLKKYVMYANGEKLEFDFLVSQIPKQASKVLIESKLATPKRFVKANPYTCRTQHPNVYCIGDCADLSDPEFEESVPKVPAFYVNQGVTVARDIADRVAKNQLNHQWNLQDGAEQTGAISIYLHSGDSEAIEIVCNSFVKDGSVDPYKMRNSSKDHMRKLLSWWSSQIEQWFEVKQAY